MEVNGSPNKKTGYMDIVREAIRAPDNSISIILGIPFVFALIWLPFEKESAFRILDTYYIPVILIGPFTPLFLYAYYTGNKAASAILGLCLFPFMFLYGELMLLAIDLDFPDFSII